MANEVETNKDGLQVIVDRYGIVSYNDATAIVVNSVDKEKADKALTDAEVTHRVFAHPLDLADELVAEKALRIGVKGMELSEEKEVTVPVTHRERFAIDEVDINNATEHGAIGDINDIATDYVAGLDKEEPVDSAEENTKEEATTTEE